MKSSFLKPILWCAIVLFAVADASALDADFARFLTEKEKQVREIAEAHTNKVPALALKYFDAVRADNWATATNLSEQLKDASDRYKAKPMDMLSPTLQTPIWHPINDVIGAYSQFHHWDNKWVHRFGNDIVSSIPKGSIYFGGSDAGRFVVSVFNDSQPEGRPFFVLTQNQLADPSYRDYMQKTCGDDIHIPNTAEFNEDFKAYMTDAEKRLRAGKLKPGELVREVGGQISISGPVAIMELNAFVAKTIFVKNHGRSFYVEESTPIDWMYPYLSPHGLIMELNSEPLSEISEESVQKDHDYWKKYTGELIGDWINEKTTTKDLCDFTDKLFANEDFSGFKGDLAFIKSPWNLPYYSKLRVSIAGLYLWRAEHATDESARQRMRTAAELAFKQSFALCPYQPIFLRYTAFLIDQKRRDEALLLAEACQRIDPNVTEVNQLIKSLRAAK